MAVGAKGFTEQFIVGEMAAALLEDAGFQVERKLELSTSAIAHQSLTSGDIDTYIEYTGTALTSILGLPVQSDPQAVYDTVKKEYEAQHKATWRRPWGFNDTFAMVMAKDRADQLGIKKISDLSGKAGDLRLGSAGEFLTREDGLLGLQKAYSVKFKEERNMDPGLVFRALAQNEVDIISTFSTDGRIPQLNLVVLEDDKRFFPPYFAAPVVRQETLTKYPQLADALNKLAGKIDDQTMARLNLQVDVEKKEAATVEGVPQAAGADQVARMEDGGPSAPCRTRHGARNRAPRFESRHPALRPPPPLLRSASRNGTKISSAESVLRHSTEMARRPGR